MKTKTIKYFQSVIFLFFACMVQVIQVQAQEILQHKKVGIGIDGLVTIKFPTPQEIGDTYSEQCHLQTIDSITFPVMCQQFGASIFNAGKSKLTKIGLRSIISSSIDPFGLLGDKENLKKKIAVGTGLLIAGATIVATCPPISVNQGFHNLSFVEKLQQAQAFGYVPSVPPNFDLDVDNVNDPQSCTATLDVSIDASSKKITDFGSFNEREFAYVSPFGSYPSAISDLAHIPAAFVSCQASLLSLVDISFGSGVSLDFEGSGQIPDVNLSGLLGGLFDLIIDNIGLSDYEGIALSNFNFWKNNYRSQHPTYCTNNTCQFEHGHNRMTFYENMPANAWGNVSPSVEYYQDVNVKEYFDPEITALPLEVHLEALETGGVTVNAYPPRSFTGTPPANRHYTFDESWLGIVDNCEANPTVDFQPASFYPLGNWDIPITVTDRVGNVTTDTMRIVVEDTIPPDILPLDAVGIPVADGTTVINFVDPGVGCVGYLCEGFPANYYLYPPVYFDFASITPDVECFVDNVLNVDLVPCTVAQLPVNDVSLITWNIADPSGNVTEITQEVFVRENSFNQVPTVMDVNVTIGQNNQVQIPLSGNDADYDPLNFNIINQPSNGNLDAQIEPIFQTRFTTSGMIRSASGMINIHNESGERGLLLSVPEEKRFYLYSGDLSSSGGEVVQRYDMSTIVPSAITFSQTKNINLGSTQMNQVLRSAVDAIWVGDWVNRKVYRYTSDSISGVSVEKEIFTLPASIQQPSGLVVTKNDNNDQFQVLIADKANNKLWSNSITKLTNSSNLANQTYRYNGSFEIGILPFAPDAMDNWNSNNDLSDTGEVLIASWSAKQMVYFDWDSGGMSEIWNISDLVDDLDGPSNPGLPIMQDPRDFVLMNDGPSNMQIRLFDQAELKYVEKSFIKIDHTVICSNGTAGIPAIYCTDPESDVLRLPAMVDILAIEEYNGLIYVLDRQTIGYQHLYRFDLAGRLDAMINLYNNAPSPNPYDPKIEFVDMAIMDTGNILLLDKGDSNTISNVTQLEVNSGVDDYNVVWSSNIDMNNTGNYAVALDVNASNIVVLLQKGFVKIPINDRFNQTQIVTYTQADIYSDLSLSDTDEIYASNIIQAPFSHVTRFQTNNSFLNFIGDDDNDGNYELDFNNDHSYGKVYFDNATNKLWVTDFANIFYPDLGANGETHRMPRISAYTPDGTLLERLIPNGDPNDFFSFLQPGDFGSITSMAVGPDRFYVAENAPLHRLHVFDTMLFIPVTCDNLPEGEVCQEIGYTPDNDFTGVETFTYGASDSFSATSNTATITITVIDDQQAPVLTCPSAIELEKNDNTGFVANLNTPEQEPNETMRDFLLAIVVSENTDLPVVEATHNIPASLPLGATTVTYSATDGSGNTGTCNTTITVVDTTAPSMTLLNPITAEATGLLTPQANVGLVEPSVTDFSGYVLTNNAPAEFPIGETIVTWYAGDIEGNISQQEQVIIVKDTTPPEFTVNAVHPDLIGSSVEIALNYTLPQATDAVGINNAGIVCLPAIGNMVNMGPNLVQCQVADNFGNKASTSFTVNYYDNDTDGNGIVDVLDTGMDSFSDAINGGQTSGQITDFGSYDIKVYEAPATKGVIVGLKVAYDAFPVMMNACNNKISMKNLNQETILFDDISVNVFDHVAITCLATGYEVFSLLGNNDFELQLPDMSIATITMPFNNSLELDGSLLRAGTKNITTLSITIAAKVYNIPPGGTLDLNNLSFLFADGFE